MEEISSFRYGIAISQIPIFCLFFSFSILFFFEKKNGWLSISLFSLIRLTGASCMLATLTNQSGGLWTVAFICESLGMALLIFLLINMLQRANLFTRTLTPWHFRVPELICWAGMGLSIADYVSKRQQEDEVKPGGLAQASMGLSVALYAWTLLLFYRLTQEWVSIPHEERRNLWTFGATIPFMVVRTVYSAVFTATGDKRFSPVTGHPHLHFFMSLLMEAAVLGIITWSIYTMPKLVVGAQDGLEDGTYEMVDRSGER